MHAAGLFPLLRRLCPATPSYRAMPGSLGRERRKVRHRQL